MWLQLLSKGNIGTQNSKKSTLYTKPKIRMCLHTCALYIWGFLYQVIILPHHHERNVCFLEHQVVFGGCDYIASVYSSYETADGKSQNFYPVGHCKAHQMLSVHVLYPSIVLTGPRARTWARCVDHFLNDIDSAWTVEGWAGNWVKHGGRECLTTSKGWAL